MREVKVDNISYIGGKNSNIEHFEEILKLETSVTLSYTNSKNDGAMYIDIYV